MDSGMPEFVTQVLTGSKQLFQIGRVFLQKPQVTAPRFGLVFERKAKSRWPARTVKYALFLAIRRKIVLRHHRHPYRFEISCNSSLESVTSALSVEKTVRLNLPLSFKELSFISSPIRKAVFRYRQIEHRRDELVDLSECCSHAF